MNLRAAIKFIFGYINLFSDSILKIIHKWWRPITCIAMALSIWVHGVYLPIETGTSADLVGLTALITAVVAAFAVREWGKIRGTVKKDDSETE